MKTRQLGKTGYAVGELGIGAWALDEEMDEKTALRRLCAALDSGRNFIDTSPAYAKGDAEKLVGEAVRELRARDFAVIATRVPHCDAPPPAVVASAERSLRALRAEVLPLFLVTVSRRRRVEELLWQETRGTLEQLIRAGKILHWGLAIEETAASEGKDEQDEGIALLAEPGLEVVRVAADEIGAARGREFGIVAVGEDKAALAEPSVSVLVQQPW